MQKGVTKSLWPLTLRSGVNLMTQLTRQVNTMSIWGDCFSMVISASLFTWISAIWKHVVFVLVTDICLGLVYKLLLLCKNQCSLWYPSIDWDKYLHVGTTLPTWIGAVRKDVLFMLVLISGICLRFFHKWFCKTNTYFKIPQHMTCVHSFIYMGLWSMEGCHICVGDKYLFWIILQIAVL